MASARFGNFTTFLGVCGSQWFGLGKISGVAVGGTQQKSGLMPSFRLPSEKVNRTIIEKELGGLSMRQMF